jgi:protein-tyrosine phosphatase
MRLETFQMTEQIFLGPMIDEQDWEELRAAGVTTIVSLQAENCDHFEGMEAFLRLPTVDHTAPEFDQVVMGVRFLEAIVTLNKKVYVHCYAGMGRSVLLVTAYLIQQGMTLSQALRHVHQRRPMMALNDDQFEVLEEFESFVRAGGWNVVSSEQ